jgi:hypothetical protein
MIEAEIIDFSKTLIRASSIGHLFVESEGITENQLITISEYEEKSKLTEKQEAELKRLIAKRDAPPQLSKTAKNHLISVYINEKYGRDKDIKTKEIKKGIEVEDDSIQMLSMYLKRPLKKNQERLTNDYITGHLDVFEGDDILNAEVITDIKSSYDLFTFLNNIPNKLDPLYYAQLQGYMWLTNAKKGRVAYVLANTPFEMIEEQKMWLLKKMNVISEESPEYIRECLKLEHSLTFDDIPLDEKILLYPVERDEEFIKKIKPKVTLARNFLQEIQDTHLKFNIGKI